MREKIVKMLNLISDPNRLDRTRVLLEIRVNRLLYGDEPAKVDAITIAELLAELRLKDSALFELLKSGGEAEEAVEWIRSEFRMIAREKSRLLLPTFYNADKSLALLSYALARYLRPELVLETGVGYGITSALVLLAMEHNNCGKLVSIDLPSLSDPYGLCTGLVVPQHLRGKRWSLHLGSSRRCLPTILGDTKQIGLFISDSSNIYTLQRYEYQTVWPKVLMGGAGIVNNISSKFQTLLRCSKNIEFDSIWQVEKPSSRTGLILKR